MDRAKKAGLAKSNPALKSKPSIAKMQSSSLKEGTQSVVLRQREEEPLFPRGGGSVLTPLEKKNIGIQARQDALFEEAVDPAPRTSKKRRLSSKKEHGSTGNSHSEDSVKIESLNYKVSFLYVPSYDVLLTDHVQRLVKGSLVLGQISEVKPHELLIALPNSLFGHVSITNISDQLTDSFVKQSRGDSEDSDDEVAQAKGIKGKGTRTKHGQGHAARGKSAKGKEIATVDFDDEDAGDDSSEANDETQYSEDELDLKNVFLVGQYVRAYVLSTVEDTSATKVGSKVRRRIELSLKPELTNSGLLEQEVVTDVTVMASPSSLEDHGFTMKLGLEDPECRGFLAYGTIEKDGRDDLVERLKNGAVMLFKVNKRHKGLKVIPLTPFSLKLPNFGKHPRDALTINSFLPGTAVDVVLTSVSARGLVGTVLGHLDATADWIHSAAGPYGIDLEVKYKIGQKIVARVISTFPEAEKPKVAVSVLRHVLHLEQKRTIFKKVPSDILTDSMIIEHCKIKAVEPNIGLFTEVGLDELAGFVHISRVKDGKVDSLSSSLGPFSVGTVHRGRVLGFNALDGIFSLSFEQRVLDQPFLRVKDVPIGGVVTGTVQKLVPGEGGLKGIVVSLAENVDGFVSAVHMSDVKLQHPERKFHVGLKVKARVLSTHVDRDRVRLTLKKSLVNSDAPAVKSYNELSVGLQVPGTIIKFLRRGVIVAFYGGLKGLLPISEMSEAYIHDPTEHFHLGQVVSVHILEFDDSTGRLIVSCKDPSAFGIEKQTALKNLKIGNMVSGEVTQKTDDDVFVELTGSRLRAVLSAGHLTDKSSAKNRFALAKIRAGQTIENLLVLDIDESRRAVTLTAKPSLISASQTGSLLTRLEDAVQGGVYAGFVRNISPTAVFVQFAGRVSALLPKSFVAAEYGSIPFTEKNQSIQVQIHNIDAQTGRLMVRPVTSDPRAMVFHLAPTTPVSRPAPDTDNTSNVQMGAILRATVVAVKDTQLNIRVGDMQGRISVTQVFDSIEAITDPKNPLSRFHTNQIVVVRVLGIHDAKNHRWLPISHRSTHQILECSCKPSQLLPGVPFQPLSLDEVEVDSKFLAFVNNVQPHCLWVSLSPVVQGRIDKFEVTDDISKANNLEEHYPCGSALEVTVLSVDHASKKLDLSAKEERSPSMTWESIKPDLVVPGHVTTHNKHQVSVSIGPGMVGTVQLADMSDDYELANGVVKDMLQNRAIKCSVVSFSPASKSLRLSVRASRVLSSTAQIDDREIRNLSDIEVGDVLRGFVKAVSDKGIFVHLGGDVTAMVKYSDLSDTFVKTPSEEIHPAELVIGRVVEVDAANGQLRMSLKDSALRDNWSPPVTWANLREKQTVTGVIRSVENYGAFILIDNSERISGLAHRSEMAEEVVQDARKLYAEGQKVKAKVLKIDQANRKVNLGLKPSYFEDEDSGLDDDMMGLDIGGSSAITPEDSDTDASDVESTGTDNAIHTPAATVTSSKDNSLGPVQNDPLPDVPLVYGGFDWDSSVVGTEVSSNGLFDLESVDYAKKRAKKRKPEIEIDRTAELDVNGPQTASDFERLLLGQPNSSALWIAYMAKETDPDDPSRAREIAERALKTINIRDDNEKLNVWVAYLNLELEFGDATSLESLFVRACQYNDEEEVTVRFIGILIVAKRHGVRESWSPSAQVGTLLTFVLQMAEEVFEQAIKRFGAKSSKIWVNYGNFLYSSLRDPERGRNLLARALRTLEDQPTTHIPVTMKFGAFEYRHGDPERGRTLMENLIEAFPKRLDLWHQLFDAEISLQQANRASNPGADDNNHQAVIREMFDRAGHVKYLRPRHAEYLFERWAVWERHHGDTRHGETRATDKAQEWADRLQERRAKEMASQEQKARVSA